MGGLIRKNMVICLFLFLLLLPVYIYAEPKSTEEKKAEAEQSLQESMQQIEEADRAKTSVLAEMESASAELVELLADVEMLKDEVAANKEEIRRMKREAEIAEKEKEEQKEAMKARIRYIYENTRGEPADMSDALNRHTLQDDIYAYDRKQLGEYERASGMVDRIMEELKEEEWVLAESEELLKRQKKALNKKLKKLKAESGRLDADLAELQQKAQEYRDEIERQNEEIEKMAKLSASIGAYDKSYRAPGDGVGSAIANYALQFIGNPYVWGGTSLTDGADCSGFVQSVFEEFGYFLSRTSSSQRMDGESVSADEMLPGDVVCYNGHVAIYIGNGKIVHASNERDGIKISNNFQYRPIVAIRRIAHDEDFMEEVGKEEDAEGLAE